MQSERGSVVTRRLQDFEILEELSIPGQGRDLLARSRQTGEEVRLWIGAPRTAHVPRGESHEGIVQRLAKVYHVALPRVLESFEDEGTHVLVVAPYRGVPLRRHRSTHAFSVPESIDLVKGIGAALTKAHALHFVHGGVDDDSIWVLEDGRVTLHYLGLRPFLARRPARAPEDVTSEPTEASDVFSLSRVFADLVLGRDPYDAGTELETEKRLSAGVRLRAEDLPPALPEGLRRLLARALHPDRNIRFRRAEELAGDLRVLRASWDSISRRVEPGLPFPTVGKLLPVGIGILAVLSILAFFRGCFRP